MLVSDRGWAWRKQTDQAQQRMIITGLTAFKLGFVRVPVNPEIAD